MNREYSSLRLVLADKSIVKQIKNHTIFGICSEAGSLMIFLFAVGYCVNSLYQNKLRTLSIMDRIYRVHIPTVIDF